MKIVAGAIAAAVIAGSAHTASATPAPGVPTGSVDTTPVVTRVDVDGDLKRDTVRLTRTKVSQDRYTFRITVTTAKGKRAIRDVHVADYVDGTLTPADIWGGTAHLDGVRGAEIMVDRGGNVGDFPWPHMYTWRNNRIVPAVAPRATVGDPAWTVADHFTLVAGYDFSTVRGARQVVATELKGRFVNSERLVYSGTRTTYRWAGGTWKPVRTTKTGTLSEDRARDLAGWTGFTWQQ